ncbi:NADPH-dependent 7-cyano-7-deazaguanine reductase QueF [Psychrobacter sp. I-STPA10]|uniref:NADPH-dependent 7-cyano-7-deazaguanine reductase QueF n=1 Tax=Psychrobacter sp. I-STPA10 TaxID=2585769 RepID=UPI001E467287|nr:NADPH-dependent 7-cyano-7-deazaguanine reductase QueF [Psychrobacter sp. I-STPA10]
MSIHGVLGESTSYPKSYSPEVLYPISRTLGRGHINYDTNKLCVGVDWWHAFEVSWLNSQGISQVALARFSIPATSTNIVESKSLKLYLNSLNFTEFDDWQTVQQTISKDLSEAVGASVTVQLFDLSTINSISGLLIDQPQGQCIDQALVQTAEKIALTEHPDACLLGKLDMQSDTAELQDYQLYSNLLRSNCPVTNQPDWGTVAIEMTTDIEVNQANLLKYILSFRQHNGFHEQCVEQIFADLSQYFHPASLMVRAWYTRRGGIDINPCRASDISVLPKPTRLVRQ